MVTLTIAAELDDVMTFYRDELASLGFELSQVAKSELVGARARMIVAVSSRSG